MEIIKNNYINKELIDVTCPYCNSILKCTTEEYHNSSCPVCGNSLNDNKIIYCEDCEEETYYDKPSGIGQYGLYYVKCSNCGKPIYLDDGIDVTIDNLKLEHFSPSSEDAVNIGFDAIKKWIEYGVNYLKKHPDEHICYTASGDSFVIVTRDDDEYYVAFTNNYMDVWLKG